MASVGSVWVSLRRLITSIGPVPFVEHFLPEEVRLNHELFYLMHQSDAHFHDGCPFGIAFRRELRQNRKLLSEIFQLAAQAEYQRTFDFPWTQGPLRAQTISTKVIPKFIHAYHMKSRYLRRRAPRNPCFGVLPLFLKNSRP